MTRRPYGRRPPYRRRDRLGFAATAWLVIFGAITGAAVVLSAPRAHATAVTQPVDVCAALRDHISLANIETALESTGLSQRAAGIYAGTQVRAECPEWIGYVTGQLV